ncbi:MAG: DNA mismatch repair endonuclease MutL [Ruminococcaceae bacterium]|nr:DNA mismatch repair endonuclease MutL [Oscillospiraceae bacterium]
MPKIIQLSQHVANLIAAGEVVERPASVVKELMENAVDAGASKITVEIKDGGMTFLRVTDNGCGMAPEDAKTAFLRHATSKLRNAEDLAAIGTMGFRGEALAAIAAVSRIDLMTKTPGSISGTDLHLEAGQITEESEVGCPDGTTIIIRDLFFNTPARMKFMKADTVEGGRVTAAVQLQALAHPEVAFVYLRDGKQILSTPGTGNLEDAAYCVYGRDQAKMVKVESRWENYTVTGFVSRPTDARPSRNMQTFFVNDRPVRSKLLVAALEEAYRNQLMVGKFPACVLHLRLPANAVDVNVHPAKTEVKFLSEKAVFDCIHYGVLGALNKQTDRPQVQFKPNPAYTDTSLQTGAHAGAATANDHATTKKEPFFRTMTAEEFKNFSAAVQTAPQPKKDAAAATVHAVERQVSAPVQEKIFTPVSMPVMPDKQEIPKTIPAESTEPEQTAMEMPVEIPWRMVGELYNSYILVEQGEEAFLIDKHAAHERILFEKLKTNQEEISSQMLLSPLPVRLSAEGAAELLSNTSMLLELGFEVEEFGDNTVLLRQIPMDLDTADAADALETLAADLLRGRREQADTIRDALLHTIACKAAIKAGWTNDERELLVLVKQVMTREDLKYCPHGRPICITLSKKQLEKQFKRS